MDETQPAHSVFDVAAIAADLRPAGNQPVAGQVINVTAESSVRVLHVAQPAPAHYHATADEYAYIISGSATFFARDAVPRTLTPGQMFFVRRGTVHGISAIDEGPLLLLIVDTPRRNPDDIVFIGTT